jgi:predicted phage terminase large subunit-like protein
MPTAIAEPDFDLMRSTLCERHLYDFTKASWPLVDAMQFIGGWHMEAICEHLEAVSYGQIRNLMVNVPPRFSKSTLTSVMWPAWEWGPRNLPGSQWLCMSYGARLALRDSRKCRDIIQSDWYQDHWGHQFRLVGDQNAKERYDNDHHGYRIASSIGGMGTGEGGSRLVVDDPHNVRDIESDTIRMGVLDWWDAVMPTRMNDPKHGSNILIMQRSHHMDLAGHIEAQDDGSWVWLMLPMEYEPRRSKVTFNGWKDKRTKEGELLCPERFGKAEVDGLKRRLGAHNYAAQCQQAPSPLEGSILRRDWWKYYNERPNLEEMEIVFQSWDLAFKSLATSAYVAGGVWCAKGSNIYLIDRIRDHLSFTETLQAIRSMTQKWPLCTAKFIEDTANGPAVMDTLKNEISGMIPVKAAGPKEGRAFAVSPDVEAGNVWLPSMALCPWVDEYVEQLAQFPRGAYKDDMDMTTQAIMQIRKRQRTLDTSKLPPVVSLTRPSPTRIE